jgi:hypothetical protein
VSAGAWGDDDEARRFVDQAVGVLPEDGSAISGDERSLDFAGTSMTISLPPDRIARPSDRLSVHADGAGLDRAHDSGPRQRHERCQRLVDPLRRLGQADAVPLAFASVVRARVTLQSRSLNR